MKDFKGTPGPWHYDDELDGVYSKGGQFVCDVTDKNNATLIAAAPELLEALRQLRDYAEDVCAVSSSDCHKEHPLMLATAAINKALGE